MVAWGNNYYGQINIPSGLSNVVAVAAGGKHSLALKGLPPGTATPVALTPRVMIGTADRPFFQRLQVKNGANSYGASGLPAGLVLDPSTGIITGTPLAGGTFSVVLSATNSSGSCTWTAPLYVNLPLPYVVATNSAQATLGNWFDLPFIFGNADSLQVNGLPPGLSADTGKGLIFGMPTALGNYTVSVMASNRFGIATNVVVVRVTEVIGWGSNSYLQTRIPTGLSNVVAIAAGWCHSLVLRADGTVLGWVRQGYGPSGLSNVVSIASGYNHNLALRADGTVAAWGDNAYGQTALPSGLSNVVAVAAGAYHSLALRADGLVVGCGRNNYGQTNIPSGLNHVTALVAGYGHNLALRADGSLVGWGANDYGQLSIPNGLSNVVGIAAGDYHSLALRADGSVVGWGRNNYGQTNVPSGLSNVVAIAAGGASSLALRGDGSVVGWGDDYYDQASYASGLSNVVAIAAGWNHCLALCGLPAGMAPPQPAGPSQVFATGDWPFRLRLLVKNGATSFGAAGLPAGLSLDPNTGLITGQPLETGTFAVTLSATNTAGSCTWTMTLVVNPHLPWVAGGTFVRAGVGNWLSLEVARDADQVEASGLPPGMVTDSRSGLISGAPTAVGDYNISVAASNRFGIVNGSLVIRVAALVAWGTNSYGQTSIPAGLGNVVNAASGDLHVLALRADGRVVSWGSNIYGQTNVPANVSNVVAVAAGGAHSLALRSDGVVVGWGDNGYGQRTIPGGLSNAVAIAAGYRHSLALRSGGSVLGWGDNTYGQRTIPTGLSNAVAIAAGNRHSLALRSDGSVLGWGDNTYGQRTIPNGLSNVVAIAAGSYHSLALRADGSVVGWGQNNSKQVSIPPGLSNILAIAAGNSNSLALRADGSVVVWGDNTFGQTNVPGGLSNVVAVTAGSGHSLALLSAPADRPAVSIQNVGGATLRVLLQGMIGARVHHRDDHPSRGWLWLVHDLERRLAQFDLLVGLDEWR